MPAYAYDRLSAQDYSFLLAERENAPMHVGAVGILEAGPLRNEDGGFDIVRFRRAIEESLHWIPRYRQRLTWVPIEDWPAWIDDRHFDLGHHIRHIALPAPGTPEQLQEIAGRILSRRLDRARPLWELWAIEGLHGGEQVALLNKIHHCMMDGAAGAELSQILFSPSPRHRPSEPLPYYPRPAPSGAELLSDRVRDALGAPFRMLQSARRWTRSEERGRLSALGIRARALRELAGMALRPASSSPINGELSPHRRVDWLTMPLDDVRELRRVLDCTINDVVLAIVTGALRRYLFRRRVDPARLDFRVSAPVSMRRTSPTSQLGNQVSSWIVTLPLGEEDPLAQLAAIRESTADLKRSNGALALDTIMAAAEYLPVPLLRRSVELARGPVNSIVTNVPGPQFPLYSVGSRLLGLYPYVPLIPGCGLGIALFSYEGKLCWGLNADFHLVPNLGDLTADLSWSFERLRSATVARFLSDRTAPAESPDDDEAAVAATPPRPGRPAVVPDRAADNSDAAEASDASDASEGTPSEARPAPGGAARGSDEHGEQDATFDAGQPTRDTPREAALA